MPKDTLRDLRTFPLLGDLMFCISSEDMENLKRHRNKCYMLKVLKQAAQLKQGQPQEFKVPRSKPPSSFRGSTVTASQPKSKNRTAEIPFSQQSQSKSQSSCPQCRQQQTHQAQSSRTDSKEEAPITPRGSEYLWLPNLGHFLEGSTPPPPQNIPVRQVRGRLLCIWESWEGLGLDPWIINPVRIGYSISFWHEPPLSRTPTVQSGLTNSNKNALLKTEFQNLLKKRAVEIPEDKTTLGF